MCCVSCRQQQQLSLARAGFVQPLGACSIAHDPQQLFARGPDAHGAGRGCGAARVWSRCLQAVCGQHPKGVLRARSPASELCMTSYCASVTDLWLKAFCNAMGWSRQGNSSQAVLWAGTGARFCCACSNCLQHLRRHAMVQQACLVPTSAHAASSWPMLHNTLHATDLLCAYVHRPLPPGGCCCRSLTALGP